MSTQSAWNAWQQRGSRRSWSSGSNLERQTAQSAADDARRVTEENVKRGSDSMSAVVWLNSGETRRLETRSESEAVATAAEDDDVEEV